MIQNFIRDYPANYRRGLILLAISLPFSRFLMSVALIFLCINWIFEGCFTLKLKKVKERKSLLLILSVYLVHIIGVFYSNDIDYALHDLRIKFPLFVLPFIIASSHPLNFRQFKSLLLFFIFSVVAATLFSTAIWAGVTNNEIHDARMISIFISHIRFSLLINVSIFCLAWFIFSFHTSTKEKIVFSFALFWQIFFLFILQSLTGIIIFFITAYTCIIIYIKKINHLTLRVFIIVFTITSALLITSFITKKVAKFYYIEDSYKNIPDAFTSEGNAYFHDFNNKQVENNHYIWMYVCEKELREEWNKRSNYAYDGNDKKGQELNHTLIRYLTSKGYRKDALGVSKLTLEDIQFIESGNANYLYNNPFSFSSKIYQTIWEIDVYLKGGNPSGNSITQRLIYLNTAVKIIKSHFWSGVGTGDVKQAYVQQYKTDKTPLDKKWQLRAHNQLVTFLLTFGIVGFIWIIFALLYPVFYENKQTNYFLFVFLIIAFLSMLNEDTLETHEGICFFSFFYALFLLGSNNTENE